MVTFKYAAVLVLSGYALTAPDKSATRYLNLPAQYHNGTVTVEHLSVHGNLDGFKMQTPAAPGTADFWYFDVFSAATNQTLNVSGTYKNGTDFYYEALADEGVSISDGPSGVRGDWKGIGSFEGSSLDKRNVEYVIRLDSAEMGISGSIKFKSIAPAHYPCDLNSAVGANQNLLPGLYWANAVPDAKTVVDLKVKDTKISFKDGVGYHDKNWGNKSIIDGPRYWDWGHGRLGPYSIVWYNLLDYEGNESRNSYVVKDGKVLLVSCDSKNLVVRQKGGKASWTPTTGLLENEGLTVNYTLTDGQELLVDVTTELIVRDEHGAYQRANGLLKGGIKGGQLYERKAHFEEFIFGIVNEYTPSATS